MLLTSKTWLVKLVNHSVLVNNTKYIVSHMAVFCGKREILPVNCMSVISVLNGHVLYLLLMANNISNKHLAAPNSVPSNIRN